MIKVRDRFCDMVRFKGGIRVRVNGVIIDVTKDIKLHADIFLNASTKTCTSV